MDHHGGGAVISVKLDIKNPNGEPGMEPLPLEQLVEDILAKERRIIEIMGEIKTVLADGESCRGAAT